MVKSYASAIRPIFWILVLVLGALQAWASRYAISSEDGIAYLDIGDAYWRGDWNQAINAQWSPAYSWLLGFTFGIFRPSSYWEFPTVKLVNFLIYLFTFGCFEFFLLRVVRSYSAQLARDNNNCFEVSRAEWYLLGYSLFLWFALKWIAVSSDTPDMLTAAFVFLSIGIVLGLGDSKYKVLNFGGLGLVLGLGSLSKTVMFPLSFIVLAVGFFSTANVRKALPLTFIALLGFGIVTIPFVAILSHKEGHLTYGETGKLNYAWFINPGSFVIPDHHWQGGPPGSGVPDHPTRMIFDSPAAFEFATPIGGTYPPWYDPTYWYEGITVKFDLSRHLQVFIKNGAFYFRHFLGAAIFGYLILIALSDRVRALGNLVTSWRLLIPALAGLGIYMIDSDLDLNFFKAQPDTRYIAVFIVLLFAGLFSSVRLPNKIETRCLASAFALACVSIVAGSLFFDSLREAKDGLSSRPTDWEIAEGIKNLAVQPGAAVANLGLKEYYWAKLARLRIVAEIPDAEAFWTTNVATRSQILQKISQTGAVAIVQRPGLKISTDAILEGWHEIGSTGAYIYKF